MSENILQQMQKALVLQDVFVRKAQAQVETDYDPKRSQEQLGVQIRVSTSKHIDCLDLPADTQSPLQPALLRYSVETGIRFIGAGTPDAQEPPVRAEIAATFIAEYEVSDAHALNEERVSVFQENVIYHVWPYWREFIQSTCARLRLPSVVLPMFKPKQPRTELCAAPNHNDSQDEGSPGTKADGASEEMN